MPSAGLSVLSHGRPDIYLAHFHIYAEVLQSSFYDIGVGLVMSPWKVCLGRPQANLTGRDEV